jgi:hypothetical protein
MKKYIGEYKYKFDLRSDTLPIAKIVSKILGMSLNSFILKEINENENIKEEKKSWEPFRICLLNSTANTAQFDQNWAELAVLFSRQILNRSQDYFFNLNILI